jgi:serine/threonine protein kinase
LTNLIGKSLGRYHILEQLGEGGMAIVYKAFDTRLEREVAIKVVRRKAFPEEKIERILKRFEREAKALAKLNHTNIVPIIDSGEEEGTPYLVMGYIPGGTLKEHLRGKPLTWEEAAQLLAPIARALAYSHKQGIVHRDIKPSNILITEENELMLTDFGIARVLQSKETLDLTGTGMGVGTPEYMAPEQGLGNKVDHRADIYALGIVLYEMITGRKPFQADTPMAVVIKQINDPLPRPTQFTPDLPKEVEQILLKALAKDPENRYQRMVDFANALTNPDLRLQKTSIKQIGRWRNIFSNKKVPRGAFAGLLLLGIAAYFFSQRTISFMGMEEIPVQKVPDLVETLPIETGDQVTPTLSPSLTATLDEALDSRLYDDFENTNFDGYFDQGRWSTYRESLANSTLVEQKDGVLTILDNGASNGYGVTLNLTDWNKSSFSLFEAKMIISKGGKEGNITLNVGSTDIPGGWLEFGIGNENGEAVIHVFTENQALARINSEFDTWYKFQITYDQASHRLYCFVDNREISSYRIENVSTIKLTPSIQYWHPLNGNGTTVYVDDVIIEY